MAKPTIVIIGAGIAGLAAANKLNTKQFTVTLLEARNRIGGRIHTDHSLGIPMEMGAGWIHGLENNPIAALAEQFGVQYTHSSTDNKLIFNQDRNIISATTQNQFLEKIRSTFSQAEEQVKHSRNDISLLEAMRTQLSASDKKSTLWEWFNTFLCYYTSLETDQISAKYFFEEGSITQNYLITNGYAKIIDGLAADCHIQLNTIVNKIDYSQNKITVMTNQGNIEADRVIVTLPLGVLKNNSVTFHPKLPQEKQDAMAKLHMGILNRLIMRFPKIFWPTEYNGIYISPNTQPSISFYLNNQYFIKEPILTGFTGGEAGRNLENLTDSDLIDLAMHQLRSAFGNNIPPPEKHLITRWGKDPFSQGSYSTVPLGASGSDYDTLAESIQNRLFFAGEATHKTFAATTHGAYLSGINAANAIATITPF